MRASQVYIQTHTGVHGNSRDSRVPNDDRVFLAPLAARFDKNVDATFQFVCPLSAFRYNNISMFRACRSVYRTHTHIHTKLHYSNLIQFALAFAGEFAASSHPDTGANRCHSHTCTRKHRTTHPHTHIPNTNAGAFAFLPISILDLCKIRRRLCCCCRLLPPPTPCTFLYPIVCSSSRRLRSHMGRDGGMVCCDAQQHAFPAVVASCVLHRRHHSLPSTPRSL